MHDYAGEIERIEIQAPSLGSLAYHGYRRTLNVCLASCVNLQELRIDCPLIPEQFTQDVGSRFPLLKILKLHGYGLKSIEISSLQLERLSLTSLHPIIIKAPNLSSFAFDGDLVNVSQLSMEVSRECEIGLTSPQKLDTLWFLKLKEWITKFGVKNVVFCVADFSSEVWLQNKDLCSIFFFFFQFCFLSFVDSSSSLKIICWLNFCLWIMKINFSFEDLRNISIPPPCL